MAITPWLTSDDVVDAIKRKISLPTNDYVYGKQELLNFAYDELIDYLVPELMSFNSEYFVIKKKVALIPGQLRYPIPDRALGMKLRDLYYQDQNNNEFEMSKLSPDDRASYQNFSAESSVYTYYFEGNEVVLTGTLLSNPVGYLSFSFYARPSKLVPNERAAISQYFSQTITFTSVVAGDNIIMNDVTFTAVSGSPAAYEFQIGGTDTITAANFSTAVNSASFATCTSSSNIATMLYTNWYWKQSFISNYTTIVFADKMGIKFTSIPDIIVEHELVDLSKTKGGHNMVNYDITIDQGTISGTTILFNSTDIPYNFEIGDYLTLANESIIPGIPSEFHSNLVNRACVAILQGQGDIEGAKDMNQRNKANSEKQNVYGQNRNEGSPSKIMNRHTILRYQKYSPFRRRI